MANTTLTPPESQGEPQGRRLESWKEIASFLGRDVTTVQRWERRDRLPVRRLRHGSRGSVYAYTSELEAWRAARETGPAAPAPSGASTAPVPASDPSGARVRVVTALLSVAIAVAITAALWGGRLANRAGADSHRVRSIAVLPLESLSPESEQEYFADGMTDALIGRMSSIRGLRVISRPSVMQFKGKRQPVRDVAKALDVDAVVVGSVLRSRGRVRVTAQLVAGRQHETNLWSGTFERDLGDVLTLQSELAASMASGIEVTVTGKERERLIAARTVAPEVYERYLKGRFAVSGPNAAAVHDGLRHFEDAIARDASFAAAHTGLARAYIELGTNFHGVRRPSDALVNARAAAEHALNLDPDLAEAHALRAAVLHRVWQWQDAENGFTRALELDPNNADAHMWFAQLLVARGDAEAAVRLGRRGRALDPLSPSRATSFGWILHLAGRREEAIRECRRALELHGGPHHGALWFLGLTLVAASDHDEGIRVLEQAAAMSNRSPGPLGTLAHAYGRAGRRADALRIVEELTTRNRSAYVPAGMFAIAYIGLGDHDRAFTWLERAYTEHSNLMWQLKIEPAFDPLRRDPRFLDLATRVGLE